MGPAIFNIIASGLSSLEKEYAAVLARAVVLGYAKPSNNQLTKQNQLIADFKQGGAGWAQCADIWADIDIFYLPANDVASGFWKLNWVNPALHEVTEQGGSLTKTSAGVTGTAAIAANTNFKPLTNKVKLSASDIGAFAWTDSFGTGLFGVETDATNRLRLLSGDFAVNSSRSTQAGSTPGSYHIYQNVLSMFCFNNGIQQRFAVWASATLTDFAMYFAGRNNAGVLTSASGRVGAFALGKSMKFKTFPIHGCLDRYFNGEWPFTRLSMTDITPAVIGSKDYPAFPDLLRLSNGYYVSTYRKGSDHNVSGDVILPIRISTDKGASWGAEITVFTDSRDWLATLSGSIDGSGVNININGTNYAVTFATSLSNTAANFILAYSATLAGLGVTVTNPSGAILKFHSSSDIVISSNSPSGMNATIAREVEVFNNGLGQTATGRMIYFISDNLVSDSSIRRMWLCYSDNLGASWSDPIKFTTDFEPLGQLSSVGQAITLPNGDMLKAFYARVASSGSRQVYVYKCLNADNGLVWNFLSKVDMPRVTLTGTSGTCNINVNGVNYLATFATSLTVTANNFVTTHAAALASLGITVTSPSVGVLNFGDDAYVTVSSANVTGDLNSTPTADFEEPCFYRAANGDIYMTLRSDPLVGTYITRSSDSGASWTTPVYHSPSFGKNPIMGNANDSVIMTLGRHPGNGDDNKSRAFISYTTKTLLDAYINSLATTGLPTLANPWRWRYTDDVDNWYMYGDIIYDPTTNQSLTHYARETANDFLSPTKLIQQTWG